MSRKRGKLSNEDCEFIRKNLETMSVEEIAVSINRTAEPVNRYIHDNHLMPEQVWENAEKLRMRQILVHRSYWKEVQKQFSEEELEYFIDMWTNLMSQMSEDILYSEELQLKQWITVDILANRLLRERQLLTQQIDDLQEKLDDELDKKSDTRDKDLIENLNAQMSYARSGMSSYTSQYDKLLDQAKDITKRMKASRDDRVKRIESGNESWTGYLKMIEEEKERERVGVEAELFFLASQKAKAKLSELHEYVDGNLGRPLTSYETIDKDD